MAIAVMYFYYNWKGHYVLYFSNDIGFRALRFIYSTIYSNTGNVFQEDCNIAHVAPIKFRAAEHTFGEIQLKFAISIFYHEQ